MPRWIPVLALIACAAAFFVYRYSTAPDRFSDEYAAQAQSLIQTPAVDAHYTALVEEAVAALASIDGDFSRFRVNEMPQPGEIGLLVIDTTRSDAPLAQAAKGNFLSVSGRFVLVDRRFIDLLLLNSTVAGNARMSSDIEMYGNAQDEGLLRVFMEQMRIRQLANTQGWINGALSGEGEELVRVHRELTDPDFREEIFVKMASIFTNPEAAVLMREYNSHLVGPIKFLEAGTSKGPRDYPMQAGVSLPLAGYLYGPLSHELYHINRGGVSAFIDGAFDDDRLGSALQEEWDADEFAAHKIDAAIRTGRDLELEGAREEFVLYQEFARRFFSDFTLAKRLDNLRGVFPYAHAIQIDYVPNRVCGDGGVEGFFDFEDILDIAPARPPLLSRKEVENLSQRIAAEFEITHPHALSRRAIFQDLKVGPAAVGLTAPSALDNALFWLIGNARAPIDRADLESVYISWRDGLAAGDGLSRSKFDTFLRNARLDAQAVAVCPFDACALYSFDGAWLEVGYQDNRIVHFVFLSPHFRSGETLSVVLNGETVALSRERQATQFAMLQFFIGELAAQTGLPVDEQAGRFIRDLAQCGGGSLKLSGDRHHIQATTLDEYFTFRLTYRAGK